jgi:hypothetical protein
MTIADRMDAWRRERRVLQLARLRLLPASGGLAFLVLLVFLVLRRPAG